MADQDSSRQWMRLLAVIFVAYPCLAEEISTSRLVHHYEEDITYEAIDIRLRSVREEASSLREEHDAKFFDVSPPRCSSLEARRASTPKAASESHLRTDSQKHQNQARCHLDQQTKNSARFISAHHNREKPSCAEFPTLRRRLREKDSSDDDTDPELTTPKRYVRTSPKVRHPRSKEIAVVIPATNIDKSLYPTYVPWSPCKLVRADPDLEESPYIPASQNRQLILAGDVVQNAKTKFGGRRNISQPSLPNESNWDSATSPSVQLQTQLESSAALLDRCDNDTWTPSFAQPPKKRRALSRYNSLRTSMQNGSRLHARRSPSSATYLRSSSATSPSRQSRASASHRSGLSSSYRNSFASRALPDQNISLEHKLTSIPFSTGSADNSTYIADPNSQKKSCTRVTGSENASRDQPHACDDHNSEALLHDSKTASEHLREPQNLKPGTAAVRRDTLFDVNCYRKSNQHAYEDRGGEKSSKFRNSEGEESDVLNEYLQSADCDRRANGKRENLGRDRANAEDELFLRDDNEPFAMLEIKNLAKGNDEGKKNVKERQKEDSAIGDSDFCANSEEELQTIEEQIRQSQRSSGQIDRQTTRQWFEAVPHGHNMMKGKARATKSEVRAMYEYGRTRAHPRQRAHEVGATRSASSNSSARNSRQKDSFSRNPAVGSSQPHHHDPDISCYASPDLVGQGQNSRQSMPSGIQESLPNVISQKRKRQIREVAGQAFSQNTYSSSQETLRTPISGQEGYKIPAKEVQARLQNAAKREKMRADNLEVLRMSEAWMARYQGSKKYQIIEKTEDEDDGTENSSYDSEAAIDQDQAENVSDSSETQCKLCRKKGEYARHASETEREKEVSSGSDNMWACGSRRVHQRQSEISNASASSSDSSESSASSNTDTDAEASDQ